MMHSRQLGLTYVSGNSRYYHNQLNLTRYSWFIFTHRTRPRQPSLEPAWAVDPFYTRPACGWRGNCARHHRRRPQRFLQWISRLWSPVCPPPVGPIKSPSRRPPFVSLEAWAGVVEPHHHDPTSSNDELRLTRRLARRYRAALSACARRESYSV